MYRFNAEDPGQSLYTPTTVGVIMCHAHMKSIYTFVTQHLPHGHTRNARDVTALYSKNPQTKNYTTRYDRGDFGPACGPFVCSVVCHGKRDCVYAVHVCDE